MSDEKEEAINLKFRTNIPEFVTFQYDSGREREGKYGKFFSYGVKWRQEGGKEVMAYMAATPILNDQLQLIGNLKGKTVQILKYEVGNNKIWKILDTQGNDLTKKDEVKSAGTTMTKEEEIQEAERLAKNEKEETAGGFRCSGCGRALSVTLEIE